MYYSFIKSTVATCIIATHLLFPFAEIDKEIDISEVAEPTPIVTIEPLTPPPTATPTIEPTPEPTPESTPTPNPYKPALTQEEIELIALVTMAEAEGECEEGKRLVIDTILNRVEAKDRWGNTVHEVVYAPHQFSSMWNGRVKRCYVREDIVQLVKEELISRTNYEVTYFRMYNYSPFGVPLFKVGCHYFSTYK